MIDDVASKSNFGRQFQSFLAKVSPPEKKEEDTKKSDEKKGE